MPNHHPRPISQLSPLTLLFPLALVLFEFATYISNDMILPAMPTIVHLFGVDPSHIPSAMSLCLLGGASLQWLLGPLSDRKGRKPIMLAGVLLFIFACIAIIFVHSYSWFLFFRFLQGTGMCFIGAVGYAAIQESFTEATAIRVTALMANVALIAPLIGPLAGAMLLQASDWEWIFIFVAIIATISALGLWRFMPETSPKISSPLKVSSLKNDYMAVLRNRRFLAGAISIGFTSMPLLAWIALAPLILMNDAGLSTIDYGYWQIPVFAGLILGNIILAKVVGSVPIYRIIKLGSIPFLLGFVLSLHLIYAPTAWIWLVASLSISAVGIGIINAAQFRLALFASDQSKGTVSAALGIIIMIIFSLGIELAKLAHEYAGNAGFVMVCIAGALTAVTARRRFLRGQFGEDAQ
ncbi:MULTISPECIES: MFS transporter [Deefgea]|uniref:MdfA family multidrug efflux MFS transporter n=1 Tax=Deefgea chitinilytica TaxID=570276 RepID=A0ABS2C9F7_9NEIS|nr:MULTISPECIES: MFS transporter [Deefgea]MBM5570784.1 MdfA family multidrug efflux MFS transporter [Deefgea chitinilytica]MBM9888013.1 MFS transporter [Deefgea sp. CFH1-16]